jgi:fructosamine-3-kinase
MIDEALAQTLGSAVLGRRPLSGGDINEAFELSLADGRTLFVKTNRHAPPDMFPAEAKGLAWLAEANALRIPRVVVATPDFLVLEKIDSVGRQPDFDERLGRGLAKLHRAGAPFFGCEHQNFIGRLPQDNRAASTWPDFYCVRRLEPQLKLAVDNGLVSAGLRRSFDRLFAVLEDRVGPPEPPARLHGDLWGGNLLTDDAGHPCLIDPAVYGGHREVDLAMMQLFGGFGSRVFDAYDEVLPLAKAHRERIPLYQLYPLMVHLNLFGGSYRPSIEAALRALL